MLRLLLSQRGYKCTILSDGVPAVEYVRNAVENEEELPSIIFMDYSMPCMSGPEAVKSIRRLGYDGAVIGITGNANQTDQRIFREAGTDSILWKPINAKMLEEAIRDSSN
jgi:CheY-like chemotaxis protein